MPTAQEMFAYYDNQQNPIPAVDTSTSNLIATWNKSPWQQKKADKQQRLNDKLSRLTESGQL